MIYKLIFYSSRNWEIHKLIQRYCDYTVGFQEGKGFLEDVNQIKSLGVRYCFESDQS